MIMKPSGPAIQIAHFTGFMIHDIAGVMIIDTIDGLEPVAGDELVNH
jgi:hypothetical protein